MLKFHAYNTRQCGKSGLVVKLIKITGHSGIPGNEYVDCKAKKLAKNISSGKIDAPSVMSISDARKFSTDIAVKSWQRKWDEDSKGRRIYELIPKIGTKILWPRKRDTGISYGRMLLNDTICCIMIVTVQEPLSLRSVFVKKTMKLYIIYFFTAADTAML